jgi:hypothetical protein
VHNSSSPLRLFMLYMLGLDTKGGEDVDKLILKQIQPEILKLVQVDLEDQVTYSQQQTGKWKAELLLAIRLAKEKLLATSVVCVPMCHRPHRLEGLSVISEVWEKGVGGETERKREGSIDG